jgi:hypothetical protein
MDYPFVQEEGIMAFPESLSWVFTGDEAEEFLAKLHVKKERRPLITGSSHDDEEVHRLVIESARNRKAEWDARKREK